MTTSSVRICPPSRLAASLLLASTAMTAGVGAQTTSPSPATPPAQGSSFFADAADNGVYFRSTLNIEFAHNPVGGLKQGSTSTQYLTIGADTDLDKLMGWKGGILHAHTIAMNGEPLSSNYTGGGISAQEANAPFGLFRFTNLTLEQKLSLARPNDLNLLGGRMGAFPTFAKSDYACLLQSHFFCGAMYGFSQSTGTALTPVSTWGGRVRYDFTPKTYFQLGGFRIDSATNLASTKIFDFGGSGITGTNWLAEAGYETNYSNDPTPRHFRVATWYNTAPRNDILYNTKGLPAYKSGGVRMTHKGETGFYVLADQVVYRPDLNSRRGVALFGSAIYNNADSEAIKYALRAGVVKQGTFAGREADTVALAAGVMALSSNAVENYNGLQKKAGGVGNVAQNEGVFEVSYGYQVRPGVTLRPNLQYYVNPDPRNATSSAKKIPNIGVIGLTLNVSLDTLLGAPRMPQ
jgi:porin